MKIKQFTSDLINIIRSNRIIQIFIAIVFIGTILRFYGITNVENTDEYNEVIEALRVASGKFNLNRWHKKGYQNILAFEYGIYFIIGYIFNIFSSPMDFAAKIVGNMEPLFLIGRYTTATLGTFSIVLLYLIGAKIYNKNVALVASILLSVTTVHVWTSHLVGTDVPLTFFFLLSLYFITNYFYSGKVKDYFLAAFFGAVAINMKIIGVGIGIIFILAHILRCKNSKQKIINYVYSKEILISVIAFILGYIISNPAIVIGIKQWLMSFFWRFGVYTNIYDEVPYAIDGNAYYTYVLLLFQEYGLPGFLLMVSGIIYALYKRENWDYIFLVFISVIYVVLSSTSFLVQDRYLMTLLPILLLLSARLLDVIINSIIMSNNTRIISYTIIVIVIIFYPLFNSIKYVVTLTDENTSQISKKWIENNIPAGSKLLMDAGRTIITAGPRLNQSKENLEKKLKLIKNLKEGETYDSPQVKIVDSYSSIYFDLLIKYMPKITYDITSTELGRKLEETEYYKIHGYEYFIHNTDLEYRINDPLWRKQYPKSAKFYDSINDKFTLIKEFNPSNTRSGPTIKIYKIN